MIPKTFSPPPRSGPSIEDRVRDAVLLAMRADDEHRKYYSYDEADPSKGVRINAGLPHTQNRSFVVPQLLIQVVIQNMTLAYDASKSSVKRITLALAHFEKPTTGTLTFDTEEIPFTIETLLSRTSEILMRGTLYQEAQVTNDGKLVDPYETPTLPPDNVYDPDGIVILNTLLPDVRTAQPIAIRRSLNREDLLKEESELDMSKEVAVVYSLLATYEIDVSDRENLRRGGY